MPVAGKNRGLQLPQDHDVVPHPRPVAKDHVAAGVVGVDYCVLNDIVGDTLPECETKSISPVAVTEPRGVLGVGWHSMPAGGT